MEPSSSFVRASATPQPHIEMVHSAPSSPELLPSESDPLTMLEFNHDIQIFMEDRFGKINARMLFDTGSQKSNLMTRGVQEEIGAELVPYDHPSDTPLEILGEVEVKWHFADEARCYITKFLVIPDSGTFDTLLCATTVREYGFLKFRGLRPDSDMEDDGFEAQIEAQKAEIGDMRRERRRQGAKNEEDMARREQTQDSDFDDETGRR